MLPSHNDARTNRSVAIYEAACKQRQAMPLAPICSGTAVYRSIPRGHMFSTARGARRIPDDASKRSGNRWDGKIAEAGNTQGQQIGRGGINLSSDTNAVFNESMFYSRPLIETETEGGVSYRIRGASADLHTLFARRLFVKFELRNRIDVVDLHANEKRVTAFLYAVQEDRGVQAAQRDLKKQDPGVGDLDLVRAVRLPDNYYYDVTRALGVAAMSHTSAAGLAVDTVRNDWARANDSQGNLILGGEDGQELSFLEPVAEIIVGLDNSGNDVTAERTLDVDEIASCASPDTIIDLSSE